ncbi:pyrroloquinoline quinone biosynthesis peptide chaperone PqqD [Maritimibacter sp. 55A14]|uniref:pyrroloquinoline quinone biosynthesis peptide chaperone PqqD n=1 Tax=Maritimibacter sp. 55A14 TaxID=2174844 RepID=UPI000D61BDD6|nr:pyrroloquinoline quinone biosynthesis peptide chaperone PqqD [Maritimibacter sp. 55A14]PWE31219.1 pyrroloquinoline quinone biosynthesis peptide chaperone PqqD [Maritimibacter sp. 55A14]
MTPGDTPLLPRGVRLHFDRVREGWVLLAPERAIRLDAIGHAILSRVDGTRSLGQIAADLAEAFDAPVDDVTRDSAEFLDALAERRIVEVA